MTAATTSRPKTPRSKAPASADALAKRSPSAPIARATRIGRGAAVIPDLPVWQQLQRIGGGLTPAAVSAYIREADTGRMYGLMDLANESRQKDGHLQAILATNEESISGLPWELVLPDVPKLKEKKAAEFVEYCLRSRMKDRFPRFIAHHVGANYYGFAVSEILFAKEGDKLVIDELRAHAPRRFAYAYENGSQLNWWDSQSGMAYPGIDFRAAYPDRFVVSQPRINGDVPCREGLVRVLMWAALFRNWAMADWVKLGEIAWKPWRHATYKKNLDDDTEADALLQVLEAMTSSGVAVLPDTAQLTIEWPKSTASGTPMHQALLSFVAGEMSKAVLGQTLTTDQPKVGSQALGNVHNEIRKDLRESRAKAVASDIDRDIIGPLLRLNFGEDIRPPTFRFLTEDPTDLVAFSTGVKQLREAGTRIPASWVREQAGIPEPEDDEECLGDLTPQEVAQAEAAALAAQAVATQGGPPNASAGSDAPPPPAG